MSAPAPLRAATVAGATLAVIFIILSAVVGGINVWRSHSASSYEAQAEQAQSEKASVDQQIADAKTRLDAANVHKDAKAWCDSVTRDTAASIRDAIKTYDSATQAVKDAIHQECAPKETYANAQRAGADAAFTPAMTECTTDQVTTTINGTITLSSSSPISSLGPLELTISGYTLEPLLPLPGDHNGHAHAGNPRYVHDLRSVRPGDDRQNRVRILHDLLVADQPLRTS